MKPELLNKLVLELHPDNCPRQFKRNTVQFVPDYYPRACTVAVVLWLLHKKPTAERIRCMFREDYEIQGLTQDEIDFDNLPLEAKNHYASMLLTGDTNLHPLANAVLNSSSVKLLVDHNTYSQAKAWLALSYINPVSAPLTECMLQIPNE